MELGTCIQNLDLAQGVLVALLPNLSPKKAQPSKKLRHFLASTLPSNPSLSFTPIPKKSQLPFIAIFE